jgi:hypothetical protein
MRELTYSLKLVRELTISIIYCKPQLLPLPFYLRASPPCFYFPHQTAELWFGPENTARTDPARDRCIPCSNVNSSLEDLIRIT